jgi:glycosyltransferase involved in cell wall biosynthesis
MSLITIIIPSRKGENAELTLESLRKQTFRKFCICQIEDNGWNNASMTRNLGFKLAPYSKYTLFSDNDIEWYPESLQLLFDTLESNPCASYSYGSYLLEGLEQFGISHEYNAYDLVNGNYISTMSLIRTDDFVGFDETLKRLQDWDLWLRMLLKKKYGVYCGKELFKTKIRNGITFGNNSSTILDATIAVLNKFKKLCEA